MSWHSNRFVLRSLLLLACVTFAARAHQPGLSTVFVELGTNRITAQLFVAWQELDASVSMDSNHDRSLSDEELAGAPGFHPAGRQDPYGFLIPPALE